GEGNRVGTASGQGMGAVRVRLSRRPLDEGVELERLRREQVERSVWDPAGASGYEDGHGGSRLAHQPAHTDRVGALVRQGSLRHPVRGLGSLPEEELVLKRAGYS